MKTTGVGPPPSRWGWVLLAVSAVPLLLAIFSRQQGDLPHYHEIAQAVWRGGVPYQDVWIEYPPYAVLWFLPFGVISNTRIFGIVFGVLLVAFDVAIKAALLSESERRLPARSALVPFALFTIVGWIQAFWYLKRLDLIPAALTLGAVMTLSRDQCGRAGALLGIAIGTKAYAAVLAPVLLFSRWRNGARPFALGLLVSLVPLALLSLFWPWWRFAAFQVGRGLQVESLPASLLWLMHHLAGTDVRWFPGEAAYEIHGSLASALLPWIEGLWGLLVIFSVGLSARAVARSPGASSGEIARLVLLPLVALVAFSPVLSPQFTIWFTGLAALAWISLGQVAAVLLAAAALTRVIYPAPHYQTGLDLAYTLVLVARNALLVGAWFALARSTWRASQAKTQWAL